MDRTSTAPARGWLASGAIMCVGVGLAALTIFGGSAAQARAFESAGEWCVQQAQQTGDAKAYAAVTTEPAADYAASSGSRSLGLTNADQGKVVAVVSSTADDTDRYGCVVAIDHDGLTAAASRVVKLD